jgi:hypothetical protein
VSIHHLEQGQASAVVEWVRFGGAETYWQRDE